MKTLLLLVVALLMTASMAGADVIGVYYDATGASCAFSPGFTTTTTVIHKFTIGTRRSHFSLELPAGSAFFAFNTTFPPALPFQSYEGIAIDYGQCKQGSFVVGTITAILTQGLLAVVPADGFSHVMVADCDLVEQAACGEGGYVGGFYPCFSCFLATDKKTWGAVKSLYR